MILNWLKSRGLERISAADSATHVGLILVVVKVEDNAVKDKVSGVTVVWGNNDDIDFGFSWFQFDDDFGGDGSDGGSSDNGKLVSR